MKRAKRGQVKVTFARLLSVLLALVVIFGTHVTGIAAEAIDGSGNDASVTVEAPSVPEENAEVPPEETETAAPVPEESGEAALPEETTEGEEPEGVSEEEPEEAEAEEPEAPAAEDVSYSASVKEVKVTATAKADAFEEEVRLVVTALEAGSDEYKEAEAALSEDGQSFDGMMAFDIGFESTATGKKVEPKDGSIVAVNMTVNKAALSELDANAINTDSMQVSHITGSSVETVADTANKTDGQVTVVTDDAEVKSVKAEFEVEGFSTFVITWTESGEEKSATIHWGTYEDGEFKEFDSTTTVDTTASSVDLDVKIDGYYYTGAMYKTSETEDGVVLGDSVIRKDTEGKWSVKTVLYDDDGNATNETETTMVEDGSHIYAYYAAKGGGGYNPPAPPPATLDSIKPETEKNVRSNGDGTYTIRLDVTGHATEDEKQGANVLVMLDMTYSMRQNDMNGTRIAAAKRALLTLIDALNPGYDAQHPDLNLVNFSLETFGNTMSTTTERSWTQSRSQMESAVRGLSNSPGAMGTNWQGGLQGAERIAEAANNNTNLNKNPTYVIFVTDGAPNCWQGHTSSSTGNDLDPRALPYAQTAANSLAEDAIFYGVFCGPASGYNNLADMVTTAHGAGTINGVSTSDMEAAFSQIAGKIVAGMAAANVTVDDGIPSLSNVSANVTAGEAGGFKYYIKPANGTETEWVAGATGEDDKGAPGATYDESNGVTWDLGEAGALKEGWIYSIEFTVWPSQEAYDTIADLNNGVKTMTQAELDAAGIGKRDDGSYYLLTNTHLYTTFTDPSGNTYEDVEQEVVSEAMELPTKTISVQKIWNNFLDRQNPPPGVKLILERDGNEYLSGDNAIEVSSSNSWKRDDIYISLGQIKKTASGYEILETGHDYEIVEPENYEGDYRWELTSEVYRPMVINGVATMLIKDDDVTGTDGTDFYILGGHKYKVPSEEENVLRAWNDRRSWLQIEKKVTGTGAPADALFEFTVAIEEAKQEDVWFSVFGPDGIIKDLETNATAEQNDSGKTGYFYAASGTSITVKIQAGWTLRFLNLNSGTTYTINETGFPDGFAFDSAEGRTVVDTDAVQDAPQDPSVSGSTVTGTINVPNVEFYVDYTNKYEETEATFTKSWDDANDQDGIRPDAVAFKNDISLLVNGTASTDYDANLTITDNGNNTYTIKYTKLPKYIDNTEVVYKLQETTVPDEYTVSPENATADNGGTITNSHTPKTTEISVTKVWEGDEDYTSLRPQSVTVVLLADGAETEVDPLVLLPDTWSGSWEGLPVNKAGTEIVYTLKELEVENYTTTGVQLTKGDDGNYTAEITNTLELEDLTVEKIVKGLFGDKEKTFSITVEALVGETSVKSKVFSLAHGQSGILEDVPVGAMIKVSEADAGDYRKEFAFTPVDGTATQVTESTAFKFTGPGTITVTNTNNTIPDTGISLDTLPYLLILVAVAVIAVLVIVRRRRRHYDE